MLIILHDGFIIRLLLNLCYNNKFFFRLGELTSANSIEESHNVADLYDKNCPKDLADNFSETYENEWADALIELTDQKNYAEEEAIRILFDIFQVLKHKWFQYVVE